MTEPPPATPPTRTPGWSAQKTATR
jgi:hypothetical protein